MEKENSEGKFIFRSLLLYFILLAGGFIWDILRKRPGGGYQMGDLSYLSFTIIIGSVFLGIGLFAVTGADRILFFFGLILITFAAIGCSSMLA